MKIRGISFVPLFWVLWSWSSFATPLGHEVGGGNSVVCATGGRLLDYYEVELFYPKRTLDLGQGGTELARVEYVLDRLSRIDKPRAMRYRARARRFFEDALLLSNVNLPDTNDYRPVPLPEGCKVVQLATQAEARYPGSKFFTLQRELYQALDVSHRAGLILHELIYEEARELGQTNSDNSRYLNGLLSSRDFEKMEGDEYRTLMSNLGFSGDSLETGPYWTENPVIAPSATPGWAYSFDLSPYVISPTQRKFAFFLLTGPKWATVGVEGIFHGIPPKIQIGDKFVVRVIDSDGRWSDTTLLVGVPFFGWKDPYRPLVLDTAEVGRFWSFDLRNNAWNDGPGELHFVSENLPSWIHLDPSGNLTGTPSVADLGWTSNIQVAVSVGNDAIKHSCELKVHSRDHFPTWKNDEFYLPPAREGKFYTYDLRGDLLGKVDLITKFGATYPLPSWLSLSDEGILSGIPSSTDLGEAILTVHANLDPLNPNNGISAWLNLSVQEK